MVMFPLAGNRSLSVYTHQLKQRGFPAPEQSGLAQAFSIASGMHYGSITASFNREFAELSNTLTMQQANLQNNLAEKLSIDPGYTGSRNQGVDLAWKYEKADIQMGGHGSAHWNDSERAQIMEYGSVRHAEGHHQKNVADYPDMQVDADNIKFYRSHQEHLQKGHGGDFRNNSDSKLIDKDSMLARTNRRRIIGNELKGLAATAVIGVGVGFALNVIADLARIGIDSVDVGAIMTDSLKSGTETGIVAGMTYLSGRLVSVALERIGIDLTTNLGMTVNFASIGILSIVIVSVYQYVQCRLNGMPPEAATDATLSQALFSMSILAVSIAAQGIYGGHAGLVVSTAAGILFFTVNIAKTLHNRQVEENLREYVIENYRKLLTE